MVALQKFVHVSIVFLAAASSCKFGQESTSHEKMSIDVRGGEHAKSRPCDRQAEGWGYGSDFCEKHKCPVTTCGSAKYMSEPDQLHLHCREHCHLPKETTPSPVAPGERLRGRSQPRDPASPGPASQEPRTYSYTSPWAKGEEGPWAKGDEGRHNPKPVRDPSGGRRVEVVEVEGEKVGYRYLKGGDDGATHYTIDAENELYDRVAASSLSRAKKIDGASMIEQLKKDLDEKKSSSATAQLKVLEEAKENNVDNEAFHNRIRQLFPLKWEDVQGQKRFNTLEDVELSWSGKGRSVPKEAVYVGPILRDTLYHVVVVDLDGTKTIMKVKDGNINSVGQSKS